MERYYRENGIIESPASYHRSMCLLICFICLMCIELMLTGYAGAETVIGRYRTGNLLDSSDIVKSQYMEMTSPDEDNMRIVSVALYAPSPGSDVRFALYLGGTAGNPSGAVKIYDSGPQHHNGNGAQFFPLTTPIELLKDTKLGLAVKWDPPAGIFRLYKGTDPEDCEQYYDNSIDEPADSLVPFNAVMGSNTSTVDHNYWYRVDIGHKPVIDSVSTLVFDEAQSGVTINGSGFENAIKVYLTQYNDWDNPGTKVLQSLSGNSYNSLSFTVNTCGLSDPTAYLWVEDVAGVTDTGVEVTLNTFADISPPFPRPLVSGDPTPDTDPESGAHVPGTFTLRGRFGDLQTVSTACQYSLDGGSSWQDFSSVTSFVDNTYCTEIDLTGVDEEVLDIQLRAYTCGGWGESAIKTRTVDTSGPESGVSFTATPGSGQCTLSWSATTDNGSGMHSTGPYEVRWQEGSDPGGCTGSILYSGTGTTASHDSLTNGRDYYYRLCYKDMLDHKSEFNGNPVVCSVAGINANNGQSVTESWIKGSAVDIALNTFTLSTNNTSGSVTDLIVSGTNTSNVGAVKIYRDDGTNAAEHDANDTFIASSTFSGTEASFNGLSIPVTSSADQYLITIDTVVSPVEGQTLTANISSGTGLYPFINYDTADTTVTIDTIAPSTSDNTPASWQSGETTITMTPNDGAGSGVDSAAAIYGCLGTGCTPSLLVGSNTITTNCGPGNSCAYGVSYYSIDRAGNVESTQTAVNQARVDRELPADGIVTAVGINGTNSLSWSGFSDSGSGLATPITYRVVRNTGPTPPVNCLSGTLRRQGSVTSFNDSNLTDGQEYSYRVCAYDAVGNMSGGAVVSVTPEICDSEIMCGRCHAIPPVDGPRDPYNGSVIGSHQYSEHQVDCSVCHTMNGPEYHVDGIIHMQPELSYSKGTDVVRDPMSQPGNCFTASCHSPGPVLIWGTPQ